MYTGNWLLNIEYNVGDIVFVVELLEYYICIHQHVSNDLTFPNKNDIYWVFISSKFLNQLVNPFNETQEDTTNNDRDDVDTIVEDTTNKTKNTKNKSVNKGSKLKRRFSHSALVINKKELPNEQTDSNTNTNTSSLKRQLQCVENDLADYKKQRLDDSISDLRDRLLLMDIDINTKSFVINKYDSVKKMSGSEYTKGMNWLETVSKIPYGKYKNMDVTKTHSQENIKEFFNNIKFCLDKNIYGLEDVKQEILEFVAKRITNPESKGHVLALCGAAGVGKCFKKNTPILMYDGNIKMVQDVNVGDNLMGDDSTPRKVLSLGSGRDTMYKIKNDDGETYTVNSEHILCLKYCNKNTIKNDNKYNRYVVTWFDNVDVKIKYKYFYYDSKTSVKSSQLLCLEAAKTFIRSIKQNVSNICEISVKRYLKLPKNIKRSLKGYYAPVEFSEKNVKIHPYIIGFLLGKSNENHRNSKFLYDLFDKYSIKKTKGIPYNYLCNSRKARLLLLAGLLDTSETSGSETNCFKLSNYNKQMINDIVYLCRSLGLLCSRKIQNYGSKIYKGVKIEHNICDIHISGDVISQIPFLKSHNINCKNNSKTELVSSIRVKRLKEDDYYGFMIDNNERFLLGNFIVTHNTKIIRSLADALDLPFYQINFGGLNDASVLTGHSETYVGSKPGKIVEILTNCKYNNPIIYLDEIDKISESKAVEIFGILTHLLDEEQNGSFQDNYLSQINLDLSKVFFVLAFNDITKVDEIVSDRLKIIYIDPPNLQDKIVICQTKMIPEILTSININNDFNIIIDEDIIAYIISYKTPQENGVRQLRKNIEKIFNRLNYNILIGEFDRLYLESTNKNIIITKSYIDYVLKQKTDDSYLNMYN